MATLKIAAEDLQSEEDRFARFRLIEWWDQKRLKEARILVIGAGALGNEIIKNLALLGIGNILIADLDRIENSNLSRSVLYRAEDSGKPKAEVAARAARQIYPDMNVEFFNGNIVYDLGLGAYQWADVVIGGLDNREARLSINRNCYRLGKPWIDGAIEQIQGCARVFVPDGPCYECTMSEQDWVLLRKRRSCNLLTKSEMETGKTPTTPTISSIIAGVQCQEAIKLLHGMPTMAGRGWIFQGLPTEGYQVEYQRKEDCYSHDQLEEIIPLDAGSDAMTVRQLLEQARQELGPEAELDLARDVLSELVCPKCHAKEELYTSLGRVGVEKAFCPHCPDTRREVVTFYHIRGEEAFLERSFAQIGVPRYDIVTARTTTRAIGYLFAGDAPEVLGNLPRQERDSLEIL